MKKPVVLLLVLVALVAFAVIYDKGIGKRLNSARLAGADMREYLLPNLAVDQVRKIRIRDAGKEVNVALAGNAWGVAERSGYRASFDKVERAVKLLADMKIKGKQVVGSGALGEIKLLAPEEGGPDRSGLQVELMNDKGAAVASLIAGSAVETTGGASSGNWMGGPGEQRFVRTPNDKDTVWLIGDSFYELSGDPKEWLDKAFLDLRQLKSAEVTMPNAADSWKAERKDENSEFKFVNAPAGDELDTAKASGLSSVLSSASFTDVLTKERATADFMKGAVKAKLVTFEGFTYDLEVLERKEGGADAEAQTFMTVKVSADIAKERKAEANEKPEDKTKKDTEFAATKKSLEEKLAKEKLAEGWVYEVSNYSVNSLLKKRGEIVREKTPPPAPAPAPGAAPVPPAPAVPQAPAPPVMPPPAAPVSVTTPPVSAEPAKPAPAPPAKPEEPKPADKPAEPKPADKAAEAKPADPKPADKSAEAKPPGQ